MKAFIRCRRFLLMRSRLRPPEKLDHLQVLPTTPFPATFTAPPSPDIALETRMSPQTSSYSHGIQELSVELGGDLVIIFTDEGTGRQSDLIVCRSLLKERDSSEGSLKNPEE